MITDGGYVNLNDFINLILNFPLDCTDAPLLLAIYWSATLFNNKTSRCRKTALNGANGWYTFKIVGSVLHCPDVAHEIQWSLTSPFPLCSTQQQYLRSEDEGKEEATLQLLLNLSAQCGVCFPCTPTSCSSLHPQPTASSVHLVHTVRDDASLEVMYCMICECIRWRVTFFKYSCAHM